VHVFSLWHACKGDDVVECANLLSVKSCSLVIGLGETYHWCTTWRSWLVGDIGSSGIVIFGESTLDKGNHFLNNMSKIGPK
jgi:hypothetical protein